ncbi:hypothetical protein IW261DRAFT_1442547 [Armillaria novae-zelandiae]|uniref:REJ domain-containing protein n=1 Tax=Armillaria novae-zelandiae TaxID=153914 RepID=A0AA39PSJ9_9AGAR|nr:hypothetical protein IW261DRAFT_1442547 [Armillaria novae-zelandiae]
MLYATSKTLSLFFLILVPTIGSFDSMLQEISSSLFADTATSTGTFTDSSFTGSGDPASTTETYVTRVSLVGAESTGDTTVLGSATYTLAVPTSGDSSVSSSDSSSGNASSASSSSSTSSPTSSSSSTHSSPSSTSTNSSSSSTTSTNKSSSTTSSSSSSSSSGTSSTSSMMLAVSLRPFDVPPTAGIVTVLLGLFFGAWIC